MASEASNTTAKESTEEVWRCRRPQWSTAVLRRGDPGMNMVYRRAERTAWRLR